MSHGHGFVGGPSAATGAGTVTTAGPPSERVRVRRRADRARYDRTSVEEILDEGFVCHVGVSDGATTWVLPTAYGRDGDTLYLHGARANHVLGAVARGVPVGVAVTLVDGLVLARSAMHHSLNFRSVVLLGTGRRVDDPVEKRHALSVVVDHVVPGRAADARPPNDRELRATLVVAVSIAEASAKVRTGGPLDDPEDLGNGVWAGVLPLAVGTGEPEPDTAGVPVPSYVRRYRRPASRAS